MEPGSGAARIRQTFDCQAPAIRRLVPQREPESKVPGPQGGQPDLSTLVVNYGVLRTWALFCTHADLLARVRQREDEMGSTKGKKKKKIIRDDQCPSDTHKSYARIFCTA